MSCGSLGPSSAVVLRQSSRLRLIRRRERYLEQTQRECPRRRFGRSRPRSLSDDYGPFKPGSSGPLVPALILGAVCPIGGGRGRSSPSTATTEGPEHRAAAIGSGVAGDWALSAINALLGSTVICGKGSSISVQ